MDLLWREVTLDASGHVPNWGLASSRTSGPETSRGGAVAAVVERASVALNSAAIDYRIRRRKSELQSVLKQIFQNHATGGVLVVVCTELRRAGEMMGSHFRYMNFFEGVYRLPQHAIDRWRLLPRLESGGRTGQLTYHFFWVTRR